MVKIRIVYDTRDKNEITKPQLLGKCSVDLQRGESKQTWLCVKTKRNEDFYNRVWQSEGGDRDDDECNCQ